MKKISENVLGVVATASKKVADQSRGDWCWVWGYKPELPACMKQEALAGENLEKK